MRTKSENLLDDSGTISLAANTELKPVWLGNTLAYAIQLVFTGTPAGSFKLQVSCDEGDISAATSAQQTASVTNWTDLPSSTTGAISAAGSHIYNYDVVGYRWAKVVWTATGAGTTPVLTVATASVKGF